MEAMVLGVESPLRSKVESALAESGVAVHACRDAWTGCLTEYGRCSLEGSAVDVAVAVPKSNGEFDSVGLACAYRERVPVVALSDDVANPVRRYASVTISADEDDLERRMMNAVEQYGAGLSSHIAAIEKALTDRMLVEEPFVVVARRTDACLEVDLVLDVVPSRAGELTEVARFAACQQDPSLEDVQVAVLSRYP